MIRLGYAPRKETVVKVVKNPNPPEPRVTEPSPYCGRLDPHEAHEHTTHELEPWKRRTIVCPGPPVIEGGSAWKGE